MRSRLSLANKCLVIFGCAIVVIIASTLAVPWARSSALVQEYQIEVSQQLADLWMQSKVITKESEDEDEEVTIHLVYLLEIGNGDATFIERARNRIMNPDEDKIYYVESEERNEQNYFQYARSITHSKLLMIRQEGVTNFTPVVTDPSLSDPIEAMLIVERKTRFAQIQIATSRNWIIVAGLVGSVFSALIFYIILKRLRVLGIPPYW